MRREVQFVTYGVGVSESKGGTQRHNEKKTGLMGQGRNRSRQERVNKPGNQR